MVTRSAARPAHRGTTGMTLYERVLAHEIDMMLLRVQDGTMPFEVVAAAARPALEEVLQAQMLASAQAAYTEVGQDPRLRNPWTPVAKQVEIPEVEFGGPGATFNVVARTHAEAVDQTTALITNMGAGTRIDIRRHVRRGFRIDSSTGLPDTTDQIARRIFGTLSLQSPANSLTVPQQAALERMTQNAIQTRLAAGMGLDAAEASIASWRATEIDRMRKFRARMIARTEVMTASNRGRRAGVFEAEAQGLVSSDSKRRWVATAGACKICRSVNRMEVGLRESWSIGEPPAHPQCRCTWVLVPAEVSIPAGLDPAGIPELDRVAGIIGRLNQGELPGHDMQLRRRLGDQVVRGLDRADPDQLPVALARFRQLADDIDEGTVGPGVARFLRYKIDEFETLRGVSAPPVGTLPPIPERFRPERGHLGLNQIDHSQRWPLQEWWQEEVLEKTFGYTHFDTLPDAWDITPAARKEALRALSEKRPPRLSQEDRSVLDLFDKRMRSVGLREDQTLTRSIRVDNDLYEDWLDLWVDPGGVGEEFSAVMPESWSLSPEWSANFAPMEVQPLQLPREGTIDLIVTARGGKVRAMGVRADKANELELVVSQGQRMRILSRREAVEQFDVLPSAIPAEAGTATEVRRIYLEVEFID